MFVNKENIDNDFIFDNVKKLPFIKNRDFRILKGGSKSVAIMVDGSVLRFPTTQDVLESQKREALISEVVHQSFPECFLDKITHTKIFEDNTSSFSYHKMIVGDFLEIQAYRNLSDVQKSTLAENLAGFFIKMHSIPISKIKEIDKKYNSYADDWNFYNKKEFDSKKTAKLLLKYLINIDDYKTSFNDDDLVVCHNDLSGSNIIINNDNFAGVIDFGNVAIMPRSNDFVPLYKISRDLATRVINHYNNISEHKISQKEIEFKMLSFIGNILVKVENNNKSSFFAELLIDNFNN